MMIIYGVVIVVYIVLFIFSEKKSKNPFQNTAAFLYERLSKKRLFSSGSVKRDMEALYPGLAHKKLVDNYYIQKISRILLLVFIGDMLAIAVCLSSLGGSVLREGKVIGRNSYGEGSIQTDLRIKTADEEMLQGQEFPITVNEQIYEEEAVREMAEEAADKLPAVILGNNSSEDEIRERLNLITYMDGYPFDIVWESDNYALLYSDGTVINEEVCETGEIVNLTAILTYGDYREERMFGIRICPPLLTKEEQINKKVAEALEKAERESRYNKEVLLPQSIEGTELYWEEKREDSSGYLFLLIGISAFGIYFLQDKDLYEKARLRKLQMLMDYPGIVNKLTLYLGAGMTIRSAFSKIAYDYKKAVDSTGHKRAQNTGVRYAYEEMLITCHELESGVGETQAYENFGKRCRVIQYTKLSSLLSQNLRKGSNSILPALRQEAENAFEERKSRAKKLGEEAGTKLLFPMMLMFGVVMILIIVPAYFSFSI